MKISEPLSIFLVDDDQLFITALKDQVKKMFKFETNIQTFLTGEECLKSFKSPPKIVILDYFLNSNYQYAMNGLQVLKKIKDVSPETKVIMLSAQDKMEIAVKLIKLGAYDYIIKNDQVFLRTKFVLSNAANTISVAKEFKNYKLMVKIVLGTIATIIIACVVIQILAPTFFSGE